MGGRVLPADAGIVPRDIGGNAKSSSNSNYCPHPNLVMTRLTGGY